MKERKECALLYVARRSDLQEGKKGEGTRLIAAEVNGGGDGGVTLKRPASGEEATFRLLIDYDP